MSKNKAAGTRWEREVRVLLQETLQTPVVRLVEGGIYDRGDLSLEVAGIEFVVECRDREAMQVHVASEKAKRKAGVGAISLLVWKRKKRQGENSMRTQVGVPVVVMPLSDMLALLHQLKGKEGSNEET